MKSSQIVVSATEGVLLHYRNPGMSGWLPLLQFNQDSTGHTEDMMIPQKGTAVGAGRGLSNKDRESICPSMWGVSQRGRGDY